MSATEKTNPHFVRLIIVSSLSMIIFGLTVVTWAMAPQYLEGAVALCVLAVIVEGWVAVQYAKAAKTTEGTS